MASHKILVINAGGFVGGDTKMFLLGLPYLATNGFQISSVSIPRGKVYDVIKALPNTTLITMELGGTELALPSNLSLLRRSMIIVVAILRIVALVRRENIELIYTVDRTIGMYISYVISRLSSCPLILNAQNWQYLKTSSFRRKIVQHAARITVSTDEMRRQFLPYVHAPVQVVKISNAIEVDKYNPGIEANEIRNELLIQSTSQIVVLAGRLNPWKGQEEFIRAAQIVLNRCPETVFLIAGSENVPGYQLHLEQLIADLGISRQVKLLGYREDIPRLFASANIVTMPSYEEPFGLVALEGMAMKKPIIATRAGGVPEFLVDGEMGILIEPHDHHALAQAIITLLDNPELAKKMGENGREQVVSFYSEKVYGQNIVKMFSDFVACRTAPYSSHEVTWEE